MKILFLLLQTTILVRTQYRWALSISEAEICAHSPKCDRKIKGRDPRHSFCQHYNDTSVNNCSAIALTKATRVTYLNGVNGIRNAVASDWRISNMNLLHWNTILQKMAEQFLLQCRLDLDECTFLARRHHNVTICQNIALISLTEDDKNPSIYAVREWYSEFVSSDSSFEEFEVRLEDDEGKKNIPNFSQMIWPTLELMGCASSK